MRRHSSGFTLIELSIVLVIIAFIVAGVMAGQTMLRQSQVMSVITDESRYVKAAVAFRDKYSALPGDLPRPCSFYASGSCPALPSANGNGLIDGPESMVGSMTAEGTMAWMELAQAGFLNGSFTGSAGSAGSMDFQPGVNVPAARPSGTGFVWLAFTAQGHSAQVSDPLGPFDATSAASYQQYLLFGSPVSNLSLYGAALSGQEAAALDSKLDDGQPNTGLILGGRGIGSGGASLSCNNAGAYPTTKVSNCIVMFQVNW